MFVWEIQSIKIARAFSKVSDLQNGGGTLTYEMASAFFIHGNYINSVAMTKEKLTTKREE